MNPFPRFTVPRAIPFAAALAWLAAAPPASAGLLATGTFQSKEAGITASGNFEIQEAAGKYKLVIQSDFQVSEGPDLFFTFNPLPAAQVTGSNAKTLALRIDPQLKTLKGAQSFDLPGDFNVDQYASLLIHCWKYNHLYAAATVKKEATSGLGQGKGMTSSGRDPGADPGPRIGREEGRVLILDGADSRVRFDFRGRTETPAQR